MTNPKALVMALFQKQGGDELLEHQAEMERDLISQANRALELADFDDRIDPPTIEERVQELQDGFVALVDGSMTEFYTRKYVDARIDGDYESVSGYVDMTAEAWKEQRELVHDIHDEKEWDTDDPVDYYIRGLFGVGREEFERYVVRVDKTEGDLLRDFLSGIDVTEGYQLFVGLGTAESALDLALSQLE